MNASRLLVLLLCLSLAGGPLWAQGKPPIVEEFIPKAVDLTPPEARVITVPPSSRFDWFYRAKANVGELSASTREYVGEVWQHRPEKFGFAAAATGVTVLVLATALKMRLRAREQSRRKETLAEFRRLGLRNALRTCAVVFAKHIDYDVNGPVNYFLAASNVPQSVLESDPPTLFRSFAPLSSVGNVFEVRVVLGRDSRIQSIHFSLPSEKGTLVRYRIDANETLYLAEGNGLLVEVGKLKASGRKLTAAVDDFITDMRRTREAYEAYRELRGEDIFAVTPRSPVVSLPEPEPDAPITFDFTAEDLRALQDEVPPGNEEG